MAVAAEVVTPSTVQEVSAVLRDTAGVVVARGAGTRQHWGASPRRCDLVVDLRHLDGIVDHAAGDMVVQVQAGVPLGRLAATLAQAGQQLALDTPSYEDEPAGGEEHPENPATATGTVGGALAVGMAGPRRLRYGAPRDLLLGVTMVRADGTPASSGGRVVKNVAGYDLGKLLCGSYGTLGLIVSATLRLHPLAVARRWVTVTAADGSTRARMLVGSQLAPSAVEIDRPAPGGPVSVVAQFDGTGGGVDVRAQQAAALVGGVVDDRPPGWFGRWPGGPHGTLVDVSLPPAAVPEWLVEVSAPVRGSAGVAALQVRPESSADLPGFLAALRERTAAYGGAAVVRHAPPVAREALDMWGPVPPGALALMRRIKDQFDPEHRLAPGRFVGGI